MTLEYNSREQHRGDTTHHEEKNQFVREEGNKENIETIPTEKILAVQEKIAQLPNDQPFEKKSGGDYSHIGKFTPTDEAKFFGAAYTGMSGLWLLTKFQKIKDLFSKNKDY